MLEVVDKLYVKDYRNQSFAWRFCYELINNLNSEINEERIPNKNPLKWCLMDLLLCVYLLVIGAFMFIALPIGSALDAHYSKITPDNDDWFISDVKIPWKIKR